MNVPKDHSIQDTDIPSTESGIMHQANLDFPALTLHRSGNVPAISFDSMWRNESMMINTD